MSPKPIDGNIGPILSQEKISWKDAHEVTDKINQDGVRSTSELDQLQEVLGDPNKKLGFFTKRYLQNFVKRSSPDLPMVSGGCSPTAQLSAFMALDYISMRTAQEIVKLMKPRVDEKNLDALKKMLDSHEVELEPAAETYLIKFHKEAMDLIQYGE